MQSVLVTGGAGFIGSNFVHYLLEAEPHIKIINLDKLTYAGSLENLKGVEVGKQYRFVQGDILNQAFITSLLREEGIDTIVHFAAETHVDRSIHAPSLFVENNIVGTFRLLEAARQVWLEDLGMNRDHARLHAVSTDEVYGDLAHKAPASKESAPYLPSSPYAASKAAADHLARSYARTYDLPVSISTCTNNYGPYQFPEKFIPLMILNCLTGKKLPIYGDGEQVRDWLYVQDHCEAIWKVVQQGNPGETYNIGGNNQSTNLRVVEQICDRLDQKLPNSPFSPHADLIAFVRVRPGHDRRYALDIGKIERELGWQPHETLESGLERTIDWYLENPAWLHAIQAEHSFQSWIDHQYENKGGTN